MTDAPDSENTQGKQSGLVPWKPGQSGNPAGKPKGARNKLGEAFIQALHDSFEANGPETIEQVRVEKPDQYLKVIASLLPKEMNLTVTNDLEDMSDDELRERLRKLTDTAAAFIGGRGNGSTGEGAETPGRAAKSPRVH